MIEARILDRFLTRILKLSKMMGGGSGASRAKRKIVSQPSRNTGEDVTSS